MPSGLKSRRFLLLLGLIPALAGAQQTSPTTLIHQAITRLHAADDVRARFTYFELDHSINSSDKGKVWIDVTYVYENTWINNLPYHRLVEENGKPLTGRKLAEEQDRYDRFVAEHQALGPAEQIRIHGGTPIDFDLRLYSVDSPDYRFTELRQETLYGQLTRVIRFDPEPSTPEHPIPQQQFTLWITATDDPILLRADFFYLDAEQSFDPGLSGRYDWQLFDGYPVMSDETSRATLRLTKKKALIMNSDRTFTRYRRFNTKVTIGPASATPPSPSPTGPPTSPQP